MPIALFVYTLGAGLPDDFDVAYEVNGDVSRKNDRFVWLSDPLPDPLPDAPEGETLEELRRFRTGGTEAEPVYQWRARLRFWEDVPVVAGGFSGVLYQIPNTPIAFRWAHSTGAKLLALHTYRVGVHIALGALAVIDPDYSYRFFDRAVRDAFGWTAQEAVARRDKMGDRLTALGYDASEVYAATTEHMLVVGIVHALGFTMKQLWSISIA